jgi:hypothetical protein
MRVYLGAALLAGAIIWSAAPADACPNCRTILSENEAVQERSPEQEQAIAIARGFSWSVLVMLAVPYMLVGGMGAGLWYAMRKPQRGKPSANVTIDTGPPDRAG